MRLTPQTVSGHSLDKIERAVIAAGPVPAGAAETYLRQLRFIERHGDPHDHAPELRVGLGEILRLYKVDVL